MRFRNKMAYDLIKGIPQMMGLRTQFVHLYVKDNTDGSSDAFQDYGLYTQVEQLNKTALKTHGLDSKGQLYKVNFFEFYREEDVIKTTDDPGYNQEAFEERLEIKGDSDHTKLIHMLDAVNDYSIPINQVLEQYISPVITDSTLPAALVGPATYSIFRTHEKSIIVPVDKIPCI